MSIKEGAVESSHPGASAAEAKRAPALGGVPFPDKDWRARIERAKEARREGKRARQGKPLTFRTKYDIE